MRSIAIGTVAFVLGAALVAVAGPELVPLGPQRSRASQNQRICAEVGDKLGSAFTRDQVRTEIAKSIEAKRGAIDRLMTDPGADARDRFIVADGKLTAAIARAELIATFCGLAKSELGIE